MAQNFYQANTGFINVTETITSDSYIILDRSTETIDSDSAITQQIQEVLDSNTDIIVPSIETIDSDATVLTTRTTETIDSDSTVQVADILENITSDSTIVTVNTETIDSDSTVAIQTSETITSDSSIEGTYEETIASDTTIIVRSTEEVDSDSYIILGRETETITSDSSIEGTYERTIDSNTQIYLTDAHTIDSDTTITHQTLRTLASNVTIDTSGITDMAISGGTMYLTQGSNPAVLWTVDIEASDGPHFTENILDATDETYKYSNAITLNETFNLGYIANEEGLICEFDLTSVGIRNEIDLEDTDSLISIDCLPDFDKVFVGTDNTEAEFYVLDNSTTDTINNKLTWVSETYQTFKNICSWIHGKIVNSDFRFVRQISSTMNNHFAFLKYSYLGMDPLGLENLVVKVDSVSLPDVLLNSVKITKTADDTIKADFILPRYFDKPDYDTEGNYYQISNNNVVEIIFNEIQQFIGEIETYNSSADSESITVYCKTSTEMSAEYTRNTVNLPMPSLNEQINPYHIQSISGIEVSNPIIDEDEEDPAFYRGVEVDLGTSTIENVSRQIALASLSQSQLEAFNPIQNWTYFWELVSGYDIIKQRSISGFYLGSSLSGLGSAVVNVETASYRLQRVFENITRSLGTYRKGQAPYQTISARSGVHVSKPRWEDKEDGLYTVQNSSYNYTAYAKKVGSIEYEKMLNINGDIAPVTTANIGLTIDALLYYNLHLLTRLNITNTTQSDIYKNSQGFPVAIKEMIIDFGTMSVSLTCDNQKSTYELEELDENIPTEPSPVEYIDRKARSKYDLATGKIVY